MNNNLPIFVRQLYEEYQTNKKDWTERKRLELMEYLMDHCINHKANQEIETPQMSELSSYHKFISKLPCGIVVLDNETVINVNKLACNILEMNEIDIVSRFWTELINEEVKMKIFAHFAEDEDKLIVNIEHEYFFPIQTGKTKLLLNKYSAFRNGNKIQIIVLIIELSGNENDNPKLKQALLRSEQMIELSVDGIVIMDAEGIVNQWNTKQEEITEINKEDAIGHYIWDLHYDLCPDDIAKSDRYNLVKKTILDAFHSKKSNFFNKPIEQKIKTKSGIIKYIENTIFPIFEGNQIYLTGTTHDITQRKEIDRNLVNALHGLENANKAKNRFIANMSHEIRTPMNAIWGFTQLLQEHLMNDAKSFNYLDGITKSSKTLLTLINEIFDFSKMETGKMEMNNEAVNLTKLFDEIRNTYNLVAQRKGLDLVFVPDINLPENIICDENRLKQILMNLVNNAIKYTDSGVVSVSSKMINENGKRFDIIFEVLDTGRGIEPEYQTKIFEPFSQMEKKDKEELAGAGLGLAISKNLVELLGGTIRLNSQLGKGSLFSVWIPQISEAQIDTIEKKSFTNDNLGEIEFKNSTVLIAEDHATNRLVMQGYLSSHQIKIIFARDGQEAIEHLENTIPDLILLDIHMPILNGFEVWHILKQNEKWKNIPVILVTAMAITDSEAKWITQVDGIIKKPIEKNHLYSMMAKFLPHTHKGIDLQIVEDTSFIQDFENTYDKVSFPLKFSKILTEEILPQYQSFADLLPLDEIENLSLKIIELSKEFDVQIMRKYAEELLGFTRNFNIEKITQYMDLFPIIVKKIENNHSKH